MWEYPYGRKSYAPSPATGYFKLWDFCKEYGTYIWIKLNCDLLRIKINELNEETIVKEVQSNLDNYT